MYMHVYTLYMYILHSEYIDVYTYIHVYTIKWVYTIIHVFICVCIVYTNVHVVYSVRL